MSLQCLAIPGIALIACASCASAALPSSASDVQEAEANGACEGRARELSIVAHQDDDLLFMNPEIELSIGRRACTRTVYVTAGDAGEDETYWSTRETGIRAAYAKMANVADAWSASPVSLAGHQVVVHTLAGNRRVSVMFLRLPDGSDVARYNHETVEKLWSNRIASITTVDGADHFDRASLVGALRGAMTSYRATVVRTLDATERPGDHVDHHHSALFAHEAHAAYTGSHEIRSFRGYTMTNEALNLGQTQRSAKLATFMAYAVHDSHLCGSAATCEVGGGYARWVGQAYRAEPAPLFPRALTAAGLKCLDVPDGQGDNGSAVQLWACADVPQQRWTLAPDGHLIGLSGKCLDVRGGSTANGAAVQIWDCADVPAQKWVFGSDGSLRGVGGKCLDVRAGDFVDAAAVQTWDCAGVIQQRWTLEPPAR